MVLVAARRVKTATLASSKILQGKRCVTTVPLDDIRLHQDPLTVLTARLANTQRSMHQLSARHAEMTSTKVIPKQRPALKLILVFIN